MDRCRYLVRNNNCLSYILRYRLSIKLCTTNCFWDILYAFIAAQILDILKFNYLHCLLSTYTQKIEIVITSKSKSFFQRMTYSTDI